MELPSIFTFVTLCTWVLSFLGVVAGQDAPLWIQGGFGDATIADTNTYNSGGSITVNGFTMTVPRNAIVQFPAAWVPWKDFVANKQDFSGFETLVIGNTVNKVPIVAQIIMYEFFTGVSGGFIESMDYANGTMKIQNGPIVRISDPNGVFSVGYSGASFMAADDQSPSITSFSGFPMCIPRNGSDSLCPLSNRPSNAPTIFTAPDPLVMAPFLPGDFITFNGFRRGAEVIAFSIVAQNVQINTIGDIAYVRMEVIRLGISNPSNNAEKAESRFIGFTSNNQATVYLAALDIDPCTGNTTDRELIASVGPKVKRAINAKAGVGGGGKVGGNPQNKFEHRQDIFTGYTREYHVVAKINGVKSTRVTKNGLVAGEYIQPVTDWIQGEQNVPGTAPVPHDFSQMAFLTKGVGKDNRGYIWGPLEPFPQSGVAVQQPVCA